MDRTVIKYELLSSATGGQRPDQPRESSTPLRSPPGFSSHYLPHVYTAVALRDTACVNSDSCALIASAKARLRAALTANHGLASHPDAQSAIADLSALAPTLNPSRSPLLLGDWRNLSAPAFPNRIGPAEGEEDVFRYTLGRLCFNIFEPRDLVCNLESVSNPIEPIPSKASEGSSAATAEAQVTYPFICLLTIHTPTGSLAAVLRNDSSRHRMTRRRR